MVGLSPHLILRTQRADVVHEQTESLGFTGNVLFDRLVGSTIYTCTAGEYGRLGSNKLVQEVCNHLIKSKTHNNPYAIPVGGSNGIGSFGYINGVDELMNQLQSFQETSPDFGGLDHIVFATGSGGTAAGISLGISLAFGKLGDAHPPSKGKDMPKVHACGVCDTPDYFYNTMADLAKEMGIALEESKVSDFVRDSVTVHQGKGKGYAFSTKEELDFISQFSLSTGIALDPVYSGKALFHFLTGVLEEDPETYRNSNILFWHTGGALGIYEKGNDLLETLESVSPVKRIDIYGKKAGEANKNVVDLS
jgi:D-cysteine desulfhydrase